MIVFWILVVLMVVIALVFLLRPLRLDSNQSDVDRAEQNIAITKERLIEIKSDLEQEVISESEYEQTRKELELSLLNDIDQENIKNTSSINNPSYNRFTSIALLLSVPIIAFGFYAFLGEPSLLDGSKKQAAVVNHSAENKMQQFEQVVAQLAKRLKQQPDNAEGWFMLGRSYLSLKHFEKAVDALEKAYQLAPKNPAVLLMYADALTMLRRGEISGKPFELIKKAVALNPKDPTGLWLIGMGYEEQGEYKKAISYWTKLLPLLNNEQATNEVQKLIRLAKDKAGIAITANDSSVKAKQNKAMTSLKVSVKLDPAILKHVSKEDRVFIFAKAVDGPPMPLAVVRKQVKDLPLQVTLDDSMAMIPSMTLSSFSNIKITARVSKTGKPLLQKGDIVSEAKQIKLPYIGLIHININSIEK